MFERITFRAQNLSNPNFPIDIGLLVESMLFYKKVCVIANGTILKQIINFFGINGINELLDKGIIEIHFSESLAAIHTKTTSTVQQFHDVVTFSSPQHTLSIELRKVCKDLIGKEGKGKRTAIRLEPKIKNILHDESLVLSARDTILNNEYLSKSVPIMLKSLIPDIGEITNIHFCSEMTKNGIEIISNLDYEKLNFLYHKRVPKTHSSIDNGFILANIVSAEEDLYYSSRNLSEIATSPLTSALVSTRLSHLAFRSEKSANEKNKFQDFIFSNQKTIRESINSGEIDVQTILPVVYAAEKFKDWLSKKDISSDLLQEYCRETMKKTFLDKLPVKTVRWSIFIGIGLLSDVLVSGGIGTATGIGISFLDGFFLERLVQGWKPNQFVENHIQGLIKS